jgi:hypothetical protein
MTDLQNPLDHPLDHPLSGAPGSWEYAGSREDASLAAIAPAHELYIGGEWRKGARNKSLPVLDPSSGETISKARLLQKHARSSRSSRPRQRQADPRERATSTCRSPAAFLLPRRPRPTSCRRTPGAGALGVCGQIIPWNFPLLMLAWKIAPALACREHRGAEAGGIHLAHRAPASPISADEAGLPQGRRQHRHRRRRDGAGDRRAPGIDKIAFTGSTEVGRRRSAKPPRARASPSRSSWAANPLHRLRRRRYRQAIEGSSSHLVQPGAGLLRGLPALRAGGHRGRFPSRS